MDLGLKGRKVLVTGASQGIGEGIAAEFAAEGASLWLAARSGDKLAALAGRLRDQHGVPVQTMAIDLTEPGAVDRAVAFAGEVEVLVNNAGAIPGGNLWDVDEAKWRAGWELKVFGYINMTRAFYKLMAARGTGVILNNIGNGGENFDFDYIAGSTGNAALMAFTRALGGKSLRDGIRVVGINPGPVDTDRIRNLWRKRAQDRLGDPSRYAELMGNYPLGRPASVAELSGLFTFLASDRSGYTSGSIVTVDGGITSNRSV
ncbi:MAG: SDR family oxidoreductase [Anaerolineae bacterium]|nr:SDR family oxidoreductase [Anaerolineae bacterium]